MTPGYPSPRAAWAGQRLLAKSDEEDGLLADVFTVYAHSVPGCLPASLSTP